ncbi:MAG: DUF1028 domain-containing protein [Rhodobacteraceae bacterium]|nr:DUF1028 domain-containing protein [Paracoccaceae bacterium]
MTYSIVARDPATGYLGITVASRFFAVGSLVPNIRHNAAMATQAFINPMWGVEGVERLSNGEKGDSVLADFIKRDPGQHSRQAHMIDARGKSFAHTGARCIDWAGHAIGEGVSVAGNMLAGPQVVAQSLECYLDNMSLPFIERLLAAMDAGEKAGGDKRGRQAAGLRIHHKQNYPHYDFRADDHSDPLAELRRLYAVSQERYAFFSDILATAENFAGKTDRTDIDIAIKKAETERLAKNIPSASVATDATAQS